MELIICEGPEAFVQAADRWCRTEIQLHGAKAVFLPAGQTPESLYEKWEREKPGPLQGLEILQIDDVLTGAKRGVFRRFFSEKLPSYEAQLRPIDEASRVADLGLLGLGLNGHVAFHEPEIDLSFFSGCVKLSAKTCTNLGLEESTWGISYGVQAFLATKALLIMVKGAGKREVLARLLKGDPALPASALLGHPRLTILADREAYPGA